MRQSLQAASGAWWLPTTSLVATALTTATDMARCYALAPVTTAEGAT